MKAKHVASATLARRGLALAPVGHDPYGDMESGYLRIIDRVRPFSLTSRERLYAACKAAEYISQNDVPGAVVECGVWRGGSAMAMALSLLQLGKVDRDIYLFDTYSGMTRPTHRDRNRRGHSVIDLWGSRQRGDHNEWDYAPLDEVRANLAATGYPGSKCNYVVGDVLGTVPAEAPDTIALLRLDTDWYESTKHELVHLYPRLSRGGVLIIDDYGHWSGAREAVDEYLSELETVPLLTRVDYTGRVAIKP